MTTAIRLSPIHHTHQQYHPEWRVCGDAKIVWSYGSDDANEDTAHTLALCDLSPLAKLGLKGPNASTWLRQRSVHVPELIYEALQLDEGECLIRLGEDEFFLESGLCGELLSKLDANLGRGQPGVARVERQEATFLLTGSRALEVLAQTCGINFYEAPANRLVMTRVAGVNCGVLPEGTGDFPRYRLWVEPTYAIALWNSLEQISSELGGQLVGALAIFSD